jgi:F-type H+-transporting ATPase subunit a
MEHELWLTALLNRVVAAPADAVLNAVKVAHDPAHPWSNWLAMELLVVAIIVVVFALLRTSLSVDRPNRLQHLFEVVYEFVNGQAHESSEHSGMKYVPYFGALFIFVLFMNLIGIIPGFESPTMTPAVPCGLAVCTFLLYNFAGMREHGVGRYLAHFAGPMILLAPIMIPIEIISHLARPLSLTIRLYANMFAGEMVTLTFLSLTYIIIPSVFMGLHVFVALLQAYIFMLLTMIYVGSAVAHEH